MEVETKPRGAALAAGRNVASTATVTVTANPLPPVATIAAAAAAECNRAATTRVVE